MKFIPIEKLPERQKQTEHKPVKEYLAEFMRVNVRYARVEFHPGEYSDGKSCYWSFRRAIKQFALPITTKMLRGELYLVRNDLED